MSNVPDIHGSIRIACKPGQGPQYEYRGMVLRHQPPLLPLGCKLWLLAKALGSGRWVGPRHPLDTHEQDRIRGNRLCYFHAKVAPLATVEPCMIRHSRYVSA